jgi:hypothetical protein
MEQSAETPASLPELIEGMTCHYVAYNHRHLAAIVIGHDSSEGYSQADLAVFTNMSNVNGDKNFGLQFHQDIQYSEGKEPGTYHWIEKAQIEEQV